MTANGRLKPELLSQDLIFGSAPILEGENPEAYDELLAQVSSAVNPSDTIERIWIRDIVDLTWELLRWRRIKNNMMAEALTRTLAGKLTPILRRQPESTELIVEQTLIPIPSPAHRLAEKWAARDPAAIKKVAKLLATLNLTIDAVIAQTFMNKLSDIEHLDRFITIAEGRRNAVLREIDRRRVVFAQELRGAVRKIDRSDTVELKAISMEKTN